MSVDELRARLHRERGALPHCVYRAYDVDGVLLYVGCTYDFGARRNQHGRKSSAWSARVARWSVRWYANREDALAVEHRAILTENPQHNVTYEERARRSAATDRRQRSDEQVDRRADLIEVMARLRRRPEISA